MKISGILWSASDLRMATNLENVRLAAACQSDEVSGNAIVLRYPLG